MNVILEQTRGRETLRVAVRTYEGRTFADMRLWYVNTDGELAPGRAGVTLKADAIPAVIDALRQAADLLRDVEG